MALFPMFFLFMPLMHMYTYTWPWTLVTQPRIELHKHRPHASHYWLKSWARVIVQFKKVIGLKVYMCRYIL